MISLGHLMKDSIKLGNMDVKLGQVISNPYARAFVKEGEEVKTKEGGDHEVFMAQSTLDSIIKAATELKQKVGEQEMDIPAWIQDHITNSENYISQANSGFYKNENTVNEGRGVTSMQRDLARVVDAIQSELEKYKVTKGTPESKKHVENLKKLNVQKKELEDEIDAKVSSLYKDADLEQLSYMMNKKR